MFPGGPAQQGGVEGGQQGGGGARVVRTRETARVSRVLQGVEVVRHDGD